MDKGFRKRVVENLRGKIETASKELLDEAVKEAGGTNRMELISAYASRLPARVIADLLGVPHGDMDELVGWSNGIAAFVLVSRNDKEKYVNAASALEHLREYFLKHIEVKKLASAAKLANGEIEDDDDAPAMDVIDAMIKAGEEKDKLSLDELIATSILLIFAGHETTTHLIANGMLALSQNPEQLRLVQKDNSLIPNCIEEILRFDGPSLANIRLAKTDFEYAGHNIKRRDRLYLFSCSANRDSAMFQNPDKFDVTRANAKRNLTFGFGKHFCIGAPLARLEGEIAIRDLISRFETCNVDLKDDGLVRDVVNGIETLAPPFVDLIVTRGMKRLPLEFSLVK